MEYLFNRIGKVLTKLKFAERFFFFFDYDGTLTPIVSQPEKANLSREQRTLLKALKNNPKCLLAIVSGRSLKDIMNKVGLEGIYYVGNHGLEIFGPGGEVNYLSNGKFIQELKKIRYRLKRKFKGIEGLLFEDKGYILAIHYRNTDPEFVPSILITLKQEVRNSSTPLCLSFGKRVFEIRPNINVNKGTAVLELLNQIPQASIFPLYMGDDQTDEDAFKIINRRGTTIFVGFSSNASAQYYVHDHFEVYQFLKIVQRELFML
ncbi:MAG: trehalose-phosphatase [Thermodesulfobacteriota bacterium]